MLWASNPVAGQPLTFYVGDNSRSAPANGAGVAAYGLGGASARLRSATVMITKNDDGVIGF
ncbi:MAG: hypothetical protein WB821_02055 [Burkholderiaceae bacterium]